MYVQYIPSFTSDDTHCYLLSSVTISCCLMYCRAKPTTSCQVISLRSGLLRQVKVLSRRPERHDSCPSKDWDKHINRRSNTYSQIFHVFSFTPTAGIDRSYAARFPTPPSTVGLPCLNYPHTPSPATMPLVKISAAKSPATSTAGWIMACRDS